MTYAHTTLALALAALASPTLATAEGRFTITGSYEYSNLYKGGPDKRFNGSIAYETDQFRIGTDGLAYHIANSDGTRLSITAASNFGRVFDPDNAYTKGLRRKADLTLGVAFKQDFDGFFVAGDFSQDVSRSRSGRSGTVEAGYALDMGVAAVEFAAGAKYASAQHNMYYYGVKASEATSSRAAYTPGSTISPFARMDVSIPVTDTTALIGSVSVTDTSKLRASPLVDRRRAMDAAIGFKVSF